MARGPLTKVHRLPQMDEVWESTVRPMRAWVTPRDQEPYRPYVILVVSEIGQVVGSDTVEHMPPPERVLSTLAKAMRRPILGGGRKRRPTVIYVDDEALVEALAPKLADVGVRFEYRHTLREVDQAMRSMEQFMTKREPIPSLLDSPGVTAPLVKGVFTAAASFYREAPWRWVDDGRPIEVRYPPDGQPRYAVVMGQGGEAYGLAAYDETGDLETIYAGTPPSETMGQMVWSSLLFSEVTEMPFDDLDDMETYGWPVAGDLAYPLMIRVTRSEQVLRPGKSELLWFEAALLGIPVFVREHMQADQEFLRPAETTLTVAMADGADAIHLRYPVPGFEVPYEQVWTAADVDWEAQAEAARERNADLLGTFEAWLADSGLSAQTVRRHLDHVALFADAYMAGEGGSVEVPRPADQADEMDVDEFLTDWFVREPARVSEGAVKAHMASLKKFYTWLKETGQVEAEDADAVLEMLREDRDYYIQLARDFEDDMAGE